MTAIDVKNLRTHHWLMVEGDKTFHAYNSGKPGQRSLCGEGKLIADPEAIHPPGLRTGLCVKCFDILHGTSLGDIK